MKQKSNSQSDMYNILYTEKEYKDVDMPDYKITNGRKLEGKKILVVGIGTARDIRYLLKDNKVWGLDSSTTAVKYCKKLGINATKMNIEHEDLGFKNSYFDVIIVKDILEHLDYPLDTLTKLKKLLKPGGYIVISVPNHFYFFLRLRILLGKNLIWKTPGHDHTKLFEEWNYMHKVFFTWNGFQKFLKKADLKIIRTFWDFGTLAHYNQPEMVIDYIKHTKEESTKRDVMLFLLKTCWKVFNFIFPRNLRSKIVSLDPGLLSAGFYVWCK